MLGANLALPSWFGCWLGCSGSVGVLGAHKPPPLSVDLAEEGWKHPLVLLGVAGMGVTLWIPP